MAFRLRAITSYMPKRPSSIALSSDSKTIFSADKFGDVYTLPLLPTREEDEAARNATKTQVKQYAPAATELTVHSKANLKSLQNQLKQAERNELRKTKEPLDFAHSLILGHVSMLTDIVIAKSSTHPGRQYVITADRDEHIRVSRGPPQSYVIEGFCHGHTEFVHNLCLMANDVLLSGGGDDDMFIWNWLTRELISKVNIRESVLKALNTETNTEDRTQKIAINGIWVTKSSKVSFSS